MGRLAEVFDVVREGCSEMADAVRDLCGPLFDDVGYIKDELSAFWDDDEDDDE